MRKSDRVAMLMSVAALLVGILSAGALPAAPVTGAVDPATPKPAVPAPASVVAPGSAGQADRAAFVDGSNAFAFDLYGKLAAKDGNLFFSPASIHTALAMTYAGAAGKTAEEMAQTLHFDLAGERLHTTAGGLMAELNNPPLGEDKKPTYQLSVANALWTQKGFPFKDEFTSLVQKNYSAELTALNYGQPDAARKTINDWVADQTKDKIKDLIGPGVLTPDTRLVLTNAVYFKSGWVFPFAKEATKDAPFHLADGKSVDVPMMRQGHSEKVPYVEDADLQAVALPYNSHKLSMVVILPKKRDGLGELEKKLTAGNVAKWVKDMKVQPVEVTLPRFKFTCEMGLADTLKAMGMPAAFDSGRADFSRMTSADKLYISAVLHKAFVAVDEEGTEAAAATAVVMERTSAGPIEQPKVFTADHPFVFLIRHNASGEILFLGRVNNPKQGDR